MNISAISAATAKNLTTILVFLLVCVACSGGPTADKVLGAWKDASDGSTTEFLSDGTVMIANSSGTTMTGKWVRLEDDRVKLEFSILGMASALVWRVTVKGDAMEATDQKGNKSVLMRQKK